MGLSAGAAYWWRTRHNPSTAVYQVKPPAPAAPNAAAKGLTVEEITRAVQQAAPAQVARASGLRNDAATVPAPAVSPSPLSERQPTPDFSATVSPATAPPRATNAPAHASTPPASSRAPHSSGEDVRAATPSALAAQNSNAVTSYTVAHSVRLPATPTPSPHAATPAPETHSAQAAPPETALTPAPINNTSNATPGPASEPATPFTLPLGTLLPVQTVARFYTVRQAGYARLQLTREVSGPGWTLRRGTEFYALARETDTLPGRAGLSVLGYIDPVTQHWQDLSGQVLGADGADGLPGRTHRLNAGWRKTLRQAGDALRATLTALAGGLSRRPLIIAGNGGAGRFPDLLAQQAQGLSETSTAQSFSEIPAGTMGYILVMVDPSTLATGGKRL